MTHAAAHVPPTRQRMGGIGERTAYELAKILRLLRSSCAGLIAPFPGNRASSGWLAFCYPRGVPIASVVLTLDPNPALRAHAWAILSADDRIELGEATPLVCPAVIDTRTTEEGVELVQSLEATAGVLRVDVVAIDFACDEETTPP